MLTLANRWRPSALNLGLTVVLWALVAQATFANDVALVLSRGTGDPDDTLEFTLAELDALPQSTIKTENEFADGMTTYRGPLVRDVLEHLGIEDAALLRFIAANRLFRRYPCV